MDQALKTELLQRLQKNALSLGVSHGFLLIAAIVSDIPFIVVQALLAGELILTSLVSLPLHQKRDQLQQLKSLLVVTVLLVVFLFFSTLTYGATLDGGHQDPIGTGLLGFGRVDSANVLLAILYVFIRLGMSVRTARASTDPLTTWYRINAAETGTTLFAIFLMVFVTLFIANPLIGFLNLLGLNVDVDAVLSSMMVALRYALMLLVLMLWGSKAQSKFMGTRSDAIDTSA